MQIVSKLQTVGMLIALVSAIGGGFYTWGTFNQRLDVIEQKEFVVNETADFTVVYEKIDDVYEKIDDLKKDIFEENKDLREVLSELDGVVTVNKAGIDFFEAVINEMKAAQGNPLLQ